MPLDFPMNDRQKAPQSGDFMRIYARVRGDIETNMVKKERNNMSV